MAITYSLGPMPKWVFINNEGTAAGGGTLETFSSTNKSEHKPVYKDAAGGVAWPNPILINLNGVQGPFYWRNDSTDPDDSYFLVAKDSDGNELWTVDEYTGGSGSGGGGNTKTYIPIVNYITNNQFIDHIDDMLVAANLTNTVIAPSNHKGFTPSLGSSSTQSVISTYGAVGPDIRFVKNSVSATDQITFPIFAFGSDPLTGDVTPVEYVYYKCTGLAPGESYKSFQFPITQKVKNLANQTMSFSLWAAVAAAPVTIRAYIRQYFGAAPAASADYRLEISVMDLTPTWTNFPISFTVPSVALKSIGALGTQTDDDALYLQIEMPLGVPSDVFFTKPKLYLGDIDPSNLEFEDYDEINSINSTPRTGQVIATLASNMGRGWVAMDDGSIGNVGSGATNRPNKDTFQLYSTIYVGVSDTYAPVSTGRTAPGTTMANAITDFLAGKRLTLPRALGRAMAEAGAGAGLTSRALGQFVGLEAISVAQMPAHTHPGSTAPIQTAFVNSALGGVGFMIPGGTTALTIASQGGGAADGNMPPTTFFNFFIKL